MSEMKTPGVYVVEKNAFANSVVEVATAVPAFIGYTAKAEKNGKDLRGKPWRITSMAEYECHFGGPPEPKFKLRLVDDPARDPTPAADMKAPRLQLGEFEHKGKTYRLTRAPGQAGNRYLMHQAMRHFFQNGGGPCYVVSVGLHGDAAGAQDIEAGDDRKGLISGLVPLLNEEEPTIVVVPDAVSLSRDGCVAVQAALLRHCGHDMRNRIAILDVWGGDRDRQDPAGDCIDSFRNDIGNNFLDFAAAYYPWVHTSLMQAGDFRDSMVEIVEDLSALAAGKPLLDKSLLSTSELHTRIRDEALKMMNLMPPSAAMAGLYTMVDNTRGVWKAPANVGMAGAVQPAVAISQAGQEDLNVSPQGKSINAIRNFVGEGVLVWGARTLAGNSLDWRYINVRRTMIMLEQSCKLAARAMVFEPNVAGTWVTLRSMISNFLTGIWKRGGLAGAVPDDAFSVHVGLGETMTPEDILEGTLRVTVRVAISRPAEFIEFSFHQQMPTS